MRRTPKAVFGIDLALSREEPIPPVACVRLVGE